MASLMLMFGYDPHDSETKRHEALKKAMNSTAFTPKSVAKRLKGMEKSKPETLMTEIYRKDYQCVMNNHVVKI